MERPCYAYEDPGAQVVENWTFSLFFLVAELWGAVVISVLFWTLANEVCTVKEAKTIYPLMGIAANVALVAAGNFMKLVSRGLAVSSWVHSVLTTSSQSILDVTPPGPACNRWRDVFLCEHC